METETISVSPENPFGTPDARIDLQNALRRCSTDTLENAFAWQKDRDPARLPIIITGIIRRFIDPDMRLFLDAPDAASLRLVDDLGIDSLTMVEIVMLVEDVTGLSIANEELKELRTLADINSFIAKKTAAEPARAA
ncbi:MAG: phosphopantetheine-binding protein [Opitutaceae bacterium]|jgi:3-hydroxyacyl-[acyl-carrier-protein] dehydratase|nr:phosphopantetheine-binding protein [Opitutaceae bacterium]